MSNELDARSISEVQKTLKILREQNRELSANNRIIREQIRLVEIRTENIRLDYQEHKDEIDSSNEKIIKIIEDEANKRESDRKGKKRELLRLIRQKTNENNQIQDQIRSLNLQILHFNKMADNLPKSSETKRITKNKVKKSKIPSQK